MGQQNLDFGTGAANDGEFLPTAFLKIQNNFTELYGSFAGKVAGPGSSTDNAIARFDGATGLVIQNSSVTIDDSGNLVAAGSLRATATTGETLTISGNSSRLYLQPSGATPLQILGSAGLGFRAIFEDGRIILYDQGVARFDLGNTGDGVFRFYSDGVNVNVAISSTVMQLHSDNIVLNPAGSGNCNITFKAGGTPDKPYGNVGVNFAASNQFRVSSGPTAANIPANNDLILATYNGASEVDRLTFKGGGALTDAYFSNVNGLGINVVPSSATLHTSKTTAGAGINTFKSANVNSSSGETHTSQFSTQDNGAGTIRTLFFCAGPLNAGVANQAQFDYISEDGFIFVARLSNFASTGGTNWDLYDRAGVVKSRITGAPVASFINTGAGLAIGGTTSASAWLTLAAGTTTLASALLTAGTLQTTATAGAIENDGKAFYATNVASSRQVVVTEQFVNLAADRTGSDVSTAQALFDTGNDVISLAAATTYDFEMLLWITRAAGAVSHTTGILFPASSAFTAISYLAQVTNPTGNVLAATQQIMGNASTETVITAANTSATENVLVWVRGTIRTNAASTLTPQFKYSAAPGGAPTVKLGSYIRLWPKGANTVTQVGNIA